MSQVKAKTRPRGTQEPRSQFSLTGQDSENRQESREYLASSSQKLSLALRDGWPVSFPSTHEEGRNQASRKFLCCFKTLPQGHLWARDRNTPQDTWKKSLAFSSWLSKHSRQMSRHLTCQDIFIIYYIYIYIFTHIYIYNTHTYTHIYIYMYMIYIYIYMHI